MRRSVIVLALLAIVENVAYGFSQPWPCRAFGVGVTSSSGANRIQSSSTTTTSAKVFTTTHHHATNSALLTPRGGATTKRSATANNSNNNDDGPVKEATATTTTTTSNNSGQTTTSGGLAGIMASLWGTTGVLYILAKAIKRVVPIALEPFQGGAALSQFELGAYIVTCLWFAYVEGYKGFQQKFSPLVVKRSFTLVPGKNGTSWFHYILAPLYSMGLIHATKKRKIVSWSVTIGVAGIVAAVKRLPYPWRNIVDAGVVVGLTWGSLSIILNYVKSWVTGEPPSQVSAELPESVVNGS